MVSKSSTDGILHEELDQNAIGWIRKTDTNEKVLESAIPWSSTCRQLSSKQFWATPSIRSRKIWNSLPADVFRVVSEYTNASPDARNTAWRIGSKCYWMDKNPVGRIDGNIIFRMMSEYTNAFPDARNTS
uniref:Uncharacterized protein n=1 Tax=Acrobeloides nanus TaxID=290746 RepID=A0A914E5M5_9BILA